MRFLTLLYSVLCSAACCYASSNLSSSSSSSSENQLLPSHLHPMQTSTRTHSIVQPYSFWTSFLQFLQCPLGPLGVKCRSSEDPNSTDGKDANANQSGNNQNGNNNSGGSSNQGGNSNGGNQNGNSGYNNNGDNGNYNNNNGSGNSNGNYNNNNNNNGSGNSNGNYDNNNNGSGNSSYNNNNGSGNSNGNYNQNSGSGGGSGTASYTNGSENKGYTPVTDKATSSNGNNHALAWSSIAIVGSVLGIALAFALMKKPAGHILTGSVGKRKGLFEKTFLSRFDPSPQGDLNEGELTAHYERGNLV